MARQQTTLTTYGDLQNADHQPREGHEDYCTTGSRQMTTDQRTVAVQRIIDDLRETVAIIEARTSADDVQVLHLRKQIAQWEEVSR